MKTTVYVVGALKLKAGGEWVLHSVDVYSEPAWSLTQQLGSDTMYVQLAPGIEGESFRQAKELAQMHVELAFQTLSPRLLAWK
jgi:hypothetical protein